MALKSALGPRTDTDLNGKNSTVLIARTKARRGWKYRSLWTMPPPDLLDAPRKGWHRKSDAPMCVRKREPSLWAHGDVPLQVRRQQNHQCGSCLERHEAAC